MSGKITNLVLAEKIDSIKEELIEMKKAEMLNTEFRLKANGVMTAFALLGGLITGLVVWSLNKFWK